MWEEGVENFGGVRWFGGWGGDRGGGNGGVGQFGGGGSGLGGRRAVFGAPSHTHPPQVNECVVGTAQANRK